MMMNYIISIGITIQLLSVQIVSFAGVVSDLMVFDNNNQSDWSVQSDLFEGTQQFGDRSYLLNQIPAQYIGAEWIRTANDSKGFTGDTLAMFYISDDIDIIIALDDRLQVLHWLSQWADTGEDIINSEESPKTFSLYKKSYQKDTWVVLGSVGQISGANNYTVIVSNPKTQSDNPDPFEFNDKYDVALKTIISSELITIAGLDSAVSISILGGEYSINSGSYTSMKGTIQNSDKIRVRLYSASDYGTISTLYINIGGLSSDFNVRTIDHPDSGWANVPGILASITKPIFPARDFNIVDYGARGDGITDCTSAFNSAIKACNDSRGGRVFVPAGEFLTGTIHLLSNTNLYISDSAVIKFSTTPADYLPAVYTRYEGTECFNYSPCIYAFEQENIAITGTGTLDAQASFDNWWSWINLDDQDVSSLRKMAEDSIEVEERVFGEGHYLRPNMIQPYRCSNILIDSITVLNGPMWHIHPVLCKNITISNISVLGHGPNNDGCNPESCTNVLIRNCYFDTGDDCIAIKSGRNADGRRINVPTSNVVIQECNMKDGHGGIVIGSEISGGANQIFAENCLMDSPNLDRALRIKTNSIRGGLIENIYLRNITVGQVSNAAVRVNFYYGEGDISTFDPVVRNIEVRNMTCNKARYGVQFLGYDRAPIRNFRLINCEFNNISIPFSLKSYNNLCLDSLAINGTEYNKIWNPDGEIDSIPTLIKRSMDVYWPGFEISPNPVTGQALVHIDLEESSKVEIKLIDLSGKTIKQVYTDFLYIGENSIPLNVTDLGTGLYIVIIQTKKGVESRRIIIR